MLTSERQEHMANLIKQSGRLKSVTFARRWLMLTDDFVYNNEEESEMGQLHAIHINLNAIADVRRKLGQGPGLSHCCECGDEIPDARRIAVPGVKYCIFCQEEFEARR